MKDMINVEELLRDCPSGMELDCYLFNGLEFDHIDTDNENYPIVCRAKTLNGEYNIHTFTKYGFYSAFFDYSKCVIFPKGKTTWEGFQRPFKDGDVIFTHANCLKVGLGNTWISIYQENRNGGVATYVDYAEDGSDYYSDIDGDKAFLCMENDILRQRLATEEEKAKLFKAIKDNGYRWNSETKTLDKLIEPKFKVGDKVKHKCDKNNTAITITGSKHDYYYIQYYNNNKNDYQNEKISFTDQDKYELIIDKFDINTLIPFESKVLVRENKTNVWQPAFYGFFNKHNKRFYTASSGTWIMCIPYNEDTKHLIGTTDDCIDFYKNW